RPSTGSPVRPALPRVPGSGWARASPRMAVWRTGEMTAAPSAALPRVPSIWRRLMVGGVSRRLMAAPGRGRMADGWGYWGYWGYSIHSAHGLQALTVAGSAPEWER